jgi:hypothetical protein
MNTARRPTGEVVSFDDWMEHCFGREVGDPPEYNEIHHDRVVPARVALYLATLFERAGELTRGYPYVSP